jgi:hypothetical protein
MPDRIFYGVSKGAEKKGYLQRQRAGRLGTAGLSIEVRRG